jgi:MoaA/NifB/PqqE/SkfB family radical SAM enzyme
LRLARRALGATLRASGGFRPEVIVFDITHACDSRCGGCAFREAEPTELAADRWAALAREARALGFGEIMLTGGEPTRHPAFGEVLAAAAAELPVSLVSNGLALEKHAEVVRAHASRVYVSYDAADEDTYRAIRGVRGLRAVDAGVRALAGRYVHARVTTWATNAGQLDAIVDRARALGFTELSLLAADTTSTGFGERGAVAGAVRPDQVDALRAFAVRHRDDRFVAMSREAWERWLALCAGESRGLRCLAPWTSGVVDPGGRWRHCFFLSSAQDTSSGIAAAVAGAGTERDAIDPQRHPVCARCVCWRG